MANSALTGLQIDGEFYESGDKPMLAFDAPEVILTSPLGFVVFKSYTGEYMDLRLV